MAAVPDADPLPIRLAGGSRGAFRALGTPNGSLGVCQPRTRWAQGWPRPPRPLLHDDRKGRIRRDSLAPDTPRRLYRWTLRRTILGTDDEPEVLLSFLETSGAFTNTDRTATMWNSSTTRAHAELGGRTRIPRSPLPSWHHFHHCLGGVPASARALERCRLSQFAEPGHSTSNFHALAFGFFRRTVATTSPKVTSGRCYNHVSQTRVPEMGKEAPSAQTCADAMTRIASAPRRTLTPNVCFRRGGVGLTMQCR
jgi:hypothetical protein